jgi:hypothetical protein
LWFFSLSNNGEILSNPTYINLYFTEDCKYGEVAYDAKSDVWNVVYLQNNNGDVDLKWLGLCQKWMPFDFV